MTQLSPRSLVSFIVPVLFIPTSFFTVSTYSRLKDVLLCRMTKLRGNGLSHYLFDSKSTGRTQVVLVATFIFNCTNTYDCKTKRQWSRPPGPWNTSIFSISTTPYYYLTLFNDRITRSLQDSRITVW